MISVVIPVLNEERRLPGCLDRLLPQAARTASEVIVVDGGSEDRTVAVARARGVRVLRARRGRGAQMNAGARVACGELLVFLPADTELPDGALDRLAGVLARDEVDAGGFRQRFDRDRLVLRWTSRLTNLRARLTGIHYGDQVPWVRRELFWRLGGYRVGVDMEDLEFGARLRRVTRPRQLDCCVTTAARRFDRYGDLRTLAEAARLLLRWLARRRAGESRVFFSPVR